MKELIPGSVDAAAEKHVPVYEVKDGHVCVTIGEVDHPMIEEHFETDPSAPFVDAVANYYKMTYDAVVNGVEPEINPYQVRQQIAVIEEAHRQNPLSREFEL